jgi:hypothetical protein
MKEEGKSCTPTAVRLDSAAPDLAMAHLDSHKIAYSELEKHDPPIGEGTTLPPPKSACLCFLTFSLCVCVSCVPCVCACDLGGFATVYKGTYKGDVVAIKVLRSGGADAFSQKPDDSNYSSSGSGGSSAYNTRTSSSSSSDAEFEAHQRRLTYEEFRHEVWIMR